jgi:hypothetical protein
MDGVRMIRMYVMEACNGHGEELPHVLLCYSFTAGDCALGGSEVPGSGFSRGSDPLHT